MTTSATGSGIGSGPAAGSSASAAPAAAPSKADNSGGLTPAQSRNSDLSSLGLHDRSKEGSEFGESATPAAQATPSADPNLEVGDGTNTTARRNEDGTPVDAATEQNILNQEQVAEKKRLNEALKKFFPDEDFSDPAAAEEFTVKTLEDLFNYKNNNVKYNQQIIGLFHEYPELVSMMQDMFKGASLQVAMARNLDVDGIVPKVGDPDYAEWENAKADRLRRKNEAENLAKEFDNNVAATGKEIEAFRAENPDLDDAQFTKFADTVDVILKDAYKGKITKQFLGIMFKGLQFDQAVKTAKEQGVTQGLNQKIRAEKLKDNEAIPMPVLNSGGGEVNETPKIATPAQRLTQDIDKFNEQRRPLEHYLSDHKKN